VTTEPVRVLEERRFDPPRPVLVEHEGRWWPGWQRAWRLCDDTRGWMAEVTWTADHEWGPGNYATMVRRERVQPQSGP
jgi:hypothetical protein